MAKILIVYENVPESTDIFKLEVSEEQRELFVKCHGHYINSRMPEDAQQACDALSVFLEGKEKIDITGGVQCPPPIDITDCDLLIHTGFLG